MRTASSAILVIFLFSAGSTAQVPTPLSVSRTCTRCGIQMKRLYRIAPTGTPIAFARDSRGMMAVVSREAPHEVEIFNSAGERVRSFGKRGQGPGELSYVSHLYYGYGDTLHAFDAANKRHLVFSPRFELSRSSAMPAQVLGATGTADGVVVAASILTPDAIGYPLHLLASDGAVQESFGTDSPSFRPDRAWTLDRVVYPRDSVSVWAALRRHYVVQAWTTHGERIASFQRSASWFRARDVPTRLNPTEPPGSFINSLASDHRGYLWIAASVHSKNWKKALGKMQDTPDGPVAELRDPELLFDTVIDVIDVSLGRVVTTARTARDLRFVGNGYAVELVMGDQFFIDVWKVEMVTR